MSDGGVRRVIRLAERKSEEELAEMLASDRRQRTSASAVKVQSRSDSDLLATVYRPSSMSPLLREGIMTLCSANMKALYEKTPGGWSEKEKRDELFDRTSRFVIIRAAHVPDILGFVNWRFDQEECDERDPCSREAEDVVEVAYCYELQVAASAQGQGIGRTLMGLLETIARSTSMRKVMLTVFSYNIEAVAFYRKNGYVIDRISPSQYEGQAEVAIQGLGSYEIMSKSILL